MADEKTEMVKPTAPEAEIAEGPSPETLKVETTETLKAEVERLQKALHERNKEEASRRKKLEELEAAEQKRAEAEMTELQKAQKEAAEFKEQLANEKLARMRLEVAKKAGLPDVFTDRLRGETPEELEDDAKAILEALPKAAKNPVLNPTNPGGDTSGETLAQQRARVRGDTVNIFNPDFARKMGGGSFINEKGG